MLKTLKIAPKLIVCFIIAVAIASLSGIAGLFVLFGTDMDYSTALVENGFSQGDIGKFNTYLNKGGAVVRDIVLLTAAGDIQAAQDELTDITTKTDEALTEMKKTCQTPDELTLIAEIESALNEYREFRDEVISLGLQNRNEEALAVFRSTARPVLNRAMTAADSLADLNKDMGNESSERLSANTLRTMILMILGIFLSIAVSVAFAVVVARSIAKPIIAVQKAAKQLEDGDLEIYIKTDSQDEIGMMTRSFAEASLQLRAYIKDIDRGLFEVAKGNFAVEPQEMYKGDFKAIEQSISTIVVSLSSTMGQINLSSEQVSSGAEQVSSSAQALSQGATEQASSVEELAASINEITDQVKQTASNAHQANTLSVETEAEVEACNQQMLKMHSAMTEISQTSSEIGKIIKTIEDIAFQTNILALNAAVEAARAGEAGKGFAVVADEVRNLASKSAEASKNTAMLIEDAIRAMQNGTEIAASTKESLMKVVEGTRGVTNIIDKISQATAEQSMALNQVSVGVDQISSVVQVNSATAEESAAASEEFSGQAQLLKELVGRFKLMPGSGVTGQQQQKMNMHHIAYSQNG